MHYAYVYINPDGKCIYAGQTCDIHNRVVSHRHSHSKHDRELMNQCKVYYTEVDDPETACNIEANLIERLRPRINVTSERIRERLTLNRIKKYGWQQYKDPPMKCIPETEALKGNLLGTIIRQLRGTSPCDTCAHSTGTDVCMNCAVYTQSAPTQLCGNQECCCNSVYHGCTLHFDSTCKAFRHYIPIQERDEYS